MSDLVAFLRARLDEDEAAVKAVMTSGACRWLDVYDALDALLPPWEDGEGGLAEALPKRLLREVAAKRAILELHNRDHECPVSSVQHHPEKGDWLYISTEYVEVDGPEWPCTTLRHLGAVYADHPDYDEAWKP